MTWFNFYMIVKTYENFNFFKNSAVNNAKTKPKRNPFFIVLWLKRLTTKKGKKKRRRPAKPHSIPEPQLQQRLMHISGTGVTVQRVGKYASVCLHLPFIALSCSSFIEASSALQRSILQRCQPSLNDWELDARKAVSASSWHLLPDPRSGFVTVHSGQTTNWREMLLKSHFCDTQLPTIMIESYCVLMNYAYFKFCGKYCIFLAFFKSTLHFPLPQNTIISQK